MSFLEPDQSSRKGNFGYCSGFDESSVDTNLLQGNVGVKKATSDENESSSIYI